ncbi:hypothetical protein GCK32_011647 [Trichostrongylus colubriformis]|uniref:Uncharacterized protein n=1 Tax=Trichostrongylus colubriformis TaxID=6319 RepID=A0AAN8FQ35_TRICO
MTQLCFEEFLGKYGFTMSDDNKLPFRNSTLQVSIMLDSSHLCSHFKRLNICMNGRYQELVDFDCLTNLTSSPTDAVFYLNQLSMIELFCGFSLPFIVYSQCLDQIAEEVTEAASMQCSEIDWNSCPSVTKSVLCRRSLVETFCEDPSSASAFCTYQQIPLRMTGWNNCENSPCCASAFHLYHLICMLILVRRLLRD